MTEAKLKLFKKCLQIFHFDPLQIYTVCIRLRNSCITFISKKDLNKAKTILKKYKLYFLIVEIHGYYKVYTTCKLALSKILYRNNKEDEFGGIPNFSTTHIEEGEFLEFPGPCVKQYEKHIDVNEKSWIDKIKSVFKTKTWIVFKLELRSKEYGKLDILYFDCDLKYEKRYLNYLLDEQDRYAKGLQDLFARDKISVVIDNKTISTVHI